MGRRAIGIAFIFSKRFLRWITGRIAATGVVGELAVDAVGRADIVGFRNVPRDGHTGQTSRSHGDLVRLRRSFRSPDRRQPRHERRIVFVSAATQTNQRRKNFSKKTKKNKRSSSHALGLGMWTFQVATDRKSPSAAQHRHRHWIKEAAGWRRPEMTHSAHNKIMNRIRWGGKWRPNLRIMCFCLCCCWTFKANPEPKMPCGRP